jgi:hypothetical protein
MYIQFTKDKGLTFYNSGDERFAVRSPTHNGDRYLRQEGATKPVLSMMPHPFASRQLYYRVAIKNDTPYEVISARIEYCGCAKDENTFIASGGTWTADSYRGGCLVTEIHATVRLPGTFGREVECLSYKSGGSASFGEGTGLSGFFLMLIDDVCCLRSSIQSNTECTIQDPGNIRYCDPSDNRRRVLGEGRSVMELLYPPTNSFCKDKECARIWWRDGCKACMCFNHGNASWCDDTRGDYYDNYFKANGVNPWGDDKVENRKCNTEFLPKEAKCEEDWQCGPGLKCRCRHCLWPEVTNSGNIMYSHPLCKSF